MKTEAPTLKKIRSVAKIRGIGIEYDRECQCYRATCPRGMRFEPDLHEVIAVFGGGILGNGQTHAEARADLLDRLLNDVPRCEVCDDPECDWCKTMWHEED